MHLARIATTAVALATLGRALVSRLLLARFRRDVGRLNRGDGSTLLTAYAEDAVLRFHDGNHRWAGDWVGKVGIDTFFQNFVAARLQGEIRQLAFTGPPWALTAMVRFDDHADRPDGSRLYENRAVLVLHTKWGKIVDHEDFYMDTDRLAAFDRDLTELGVAPISETA